MAGGALGCERCALDFDRSVKNEMTGLTNDEARALLGEAFADLLDPSKDVETLSRYFSPTCVQEVDGEVMDYGRFLDHARAIKRSIRLARVTFER
jgi:hypothetical protein